jgi:asparagine synthase (glutamine-hydrolysing)
MCGIAGIFSPQLLDDIKRTTVRNMVGKLVHRGPDSDGFFESDHVSMGMRRLSIIDLAGGRQPLFNEDRSIAIVCNGEIYNHAELRTTLQAAGHRFSSGSDVETIIHAYEEYGTRCLDHLRGMFAFALWDAHHDKLIVARDRLGEKPLFLHRDAQGCTHFSSELRSLQSALPRPGKLSPESFALFLTFQYIPEPDAPTIDITPLPAGHYIELSPRQPAPAPVCYWTLGQSHESEQDPITVTRDVIDEACRLMGTADVPVAISLSGGIDSSLVAALTARHFPGQLHAFTIGYTGRPQTDERSMAASLAKSLGIGFTEIELGIDEVVARFPEMIAAMDSPIGDIAAFGYFKVCEAARQAGYPVLLSGLGGDEFFWGYEWVRNAVVRHEVETHSRAKPVPWWRSWFGDTKKSVVTPLFAVHDELRNGHQAALDLLPSAIRSRVPDSLWLDRTPYDEQPAYLAVSNLLNRTWLRSNCLTLMDRMSMAHSVEVRLPLLDIRLVDRITSLRNAGLRDWEQPHKWLLTEALGETLSAEILNRRKQGFTPPVNEWMQAIADRFRHLLIDGSLAKHGVLDPAKLSMIDSRSLFFRYKLVLIECWTRLHLDGQSTTQLSEG